MPIAIKIVVSRPKSRKPTKPDTLIIPASTSTPTIVAEIITKTALPELDNPLGTYVGLFCILAIAKGS
jgi:hypothetical protein